MWLSPFGWLEEVKPTAGNTFWPLLLALALAVVLVAAACGLNARRDFGMA